MVIGGTIIIIIINILMETIVIDNNTRIIIHVIIIIVVVVVMIDHDDKGFHVIHGIAQTISRSALKYYKCTRNTNVGWGPPTIHVVVHTYLQTSMYPTKYCAALVLL